jgi:hypothetical protein
MAEKEKRASEREVGTAVWEAAAVSGDPHLFRALVEIALSYSTCPADLVPLVENRAQGLGVSLGKIA